MGNWKEEKSAGEEETRKKKRERGIIETECGRKKRKER